MKTCFSRTLLRSIVAAQLALHPAPCILQTAVHSEIILFVCGQSSQILILRPCLHSHITTNITRHPLQTTASFFLRQCQFKLFPGSNKSHFLPESISVHLSYGFTSFLNAICVTIFLLHSLTHVVLLQFFF